MLPNNLRPVEALKLMTLESGSHLGARSKLCAIFANLYANDMIYCDSSVLNLTPVVVNSGVVNKRINDVKSYELSVLEKIDEQDWAGISRLIKGVDLLPYLVRLNLLSRERASFSRSPSVIKLYEPRINDFGRSCVKELRQYGQKLRGDIDSKGLCAVLDSDTGSDIFAFPDLYRDKQEVVKSQYRGVLDGQTICSEADDLTQKYLLLSTD